MADSPILARVYHFAASADTFTSADLKSAFADEFASDDVLGPMPLSQRIDNAICVLLEQQLIDAAAPGTYRIGMLVSA